MSKQYSGPIPSKLTLLADLQQFSPLDKVRFLGCVTSYDKKSAILTLEHNFPVGNGIRASVNVQLLLNVLKSHETRIGEWVNILGYIVDLDGQQDTKDRLPGTEISIRAIVLWSAGAIQLDAYERSLMPQG
ncbi:hypothetical protein DSL72_001270 [Monilinia vaccinii-corymbosi]|uniref:Uncharacterized protein n=1 Tax=Monilinia vaccinii-corymbosi TaxID=61207 RepID=A0A8A3P1K0_9HELO|nr:hypothetical protein DSL72_001270 [Monilinia vaccinii-corymbosi]